QSAGIWVTLNIFTVRKLFYFLFVIPCIAITSCSKEDMASTNKNSNIASLSVGVYNPSDPEEILERIEEFLEGVVQEYMEDIPVQEAIWKLEASLNYAFRGSKGPIKDVETESYVYEIYCDGFYVNGDQLLNVFNEVYLDIYSKSTTTEKELSLIDVYWNEQSNSMHLTAYYAVIESFPVNLPSDVGNWIATEHRACSQQVSGNCADMSTAANKMDQYISLKYYHDLFVNQNIDVSAAHFHTGIYIAGRGSNGWYYCDAGPSLWDLPLTSSYLRSNFGLWGCAQNSILTPTNNLQCINSQYIIQFADQAILDASNYNPGGNRGLFLYQTAFTATTGGSTLYYHIPSYMYYGNFTEVTLNHSIHGY
ncbi:MAG: hypothetical protein EA358_02740, partial [Flavobacteriales bacterium]